jgi:predicted PurR-regulated permease PerM
VASHDRNDRPTRPRLRGLGAFAAIGLLVAAHAARTIFVTIVVGILISSALEPVVRWMGRRGVPRIVAAALVVAAGVGGLVAGARTFADDAVAFLDEVPVAATRVEALLARVRPVSTSALGRLERLSDEAAKAGADAEPRPGVVPVAVERHHLDVRPYVVAGWRAGAAGGVVVCLSFILLASGDAFRRKLVRIAGPSLARRRVTAEVLADVDRQIQRFLLVRLVASGLIGTASAIAFALLGVGHAVVWGVAAGLLNSVPYFGPGVVTVAVTLATLVEQDSATSALVVGLVSLALASLDGFVIVPLLISRAARMNEVAVFVGLMFWGWLWGTAGLLLAVPLMMAAKAACERIDGLEPLAEVFGE